MKRLIALLLSVTLMLTFAACGTPAPSVTETQTTQAAQESATAASESPTEAQTQATAGTTAESPPASDAKTIGFSVYDMQYEFFQIMERGTREQIQAMGYGYQLHDQKSSETEMVSGAINLINSGIAALIISPCKPEALSSIVAAAKEKNIPVIVDDIGGGGADYDAIVISDCYKGGQLAADYTAELLASNPGSKKVAIIKCEPEAVYAIRRGEGYKANITAAGFTVVSEVSGHSKSE
ncbi:MAG: substrate-binding domain-containing protein, partial [Oscillospiraceae bacterium]|nr:substrate-binding domain-containing protein [Oscillospiraceae bacterium]